MLVPCQWPPLRALAALLALPLLPACGQANETPPLAAELSGTGGYRLTTYDVLTVPGLGVTLRAKVEAAGPLHRDQRGVPVRFALDGRDAGSAVSAEDGYADLSVSAAELANLPLPSPLGVGSAVPFEARTGAAADGTGAVFVRAAADPVIVTDIDGTISALNDLLVPLTPVERIPALVGAAETLQALSVTRTVVYLTARDDALMHKTRAWLDQRGFPRGPLVVADWGPGFSQRIYKRQALVWLKERWPNLTAGVGNTPHDADAYLGAGMVAYNLGLLPVAGAVAVAGWDAVAAAELARVPAGAATAPGSAAVFQDN